MEHLHPYTRLKRTFPPPLPSCPGPWKPSFTPASNWKCPSFPWRSMTAVPIPAWLSWIQAFESVLQQQQKTYQMLAICQPRISLHFYVRLFFSIWINIFFRNWELCLHNNGLYQGIILYYIYIIAIYHFWEPEIFCILYQYFDSFPQCESHLSNFSCFS